MAVSLLVPSRRFSRKRTAVGAFIGKLFEDAILDEWTAFSLDKTVVAVTVDVRVRDMKDSSFINILLVML